LERGEVILLDTHIFVRWVSFDQTIPETAKAVLFSAENNEDFAISAITLWEIAKLYEYKRLILNVSIDEWIGNSLVSPGVTVIELTPEIAIESTRLPGTFHKDPADQIIVATSRVLDIPLITLDEKILGYDHVKLLS
jgi:PIN domain nuclease of toxin-antitoxin system